MNYRSKSNPNVPLIGKGNAKHTFRVKFYRNGDKYYEGFSFPITLPRYRNLHILLKDLNVSVFCDQKRLPVGVRYIFDLDGMRIKSVSDMSDGGSYVCSSYNRFIPMNYLGDTWNPVWKTSKKVLEPQTVRTLVVRDHHPIRSYSYLNNLSLEKSPKNFHKNVHRLMVIIKNGPSRPRQMYRWAFSLKPPPQFMSLMEDIADLLGEHVISHLYATDGNEVFGLNDILKTDTAFVAFREETVYETDFMISNQELTLINALKNTQAKENLPHIHVCSSANHEKNPWKKLNDIYDIGDKIGFGNFSTVRQCRNKSLNVLGALKRIDLRKCEGVTSKIYSEVEILHKLDHPNIIKLLDVFETPYYLYLVMELIKEGDVIDTIINSGYYSEHDVSGMLHNIVSGIYYLHSLNIVHRDIKIENVLVQEDCNGLKKLKICDFGLATKMPSKEPLFVVCGSPDYMAPEVISQEGYDYKVDMWAAGVFLYILLHGSPPFHSKGDFNATFENVVSGKYDIKKAAWDVISTEAKNLITMLLEPNPVSRITAEETLSQPWVAGDIVGSSINLRDPVGTRLHKYYRKFGAEHGRACVLANTAMDKESNFFERSSTDGREESRKPSRKKSQAT